MSEGEHFGVYRIQGWLGEGGMGEVYLAWDDRLKRPVAIKRIRHGLATAERRERLKREAQAVARLSHPAIVQVYDVVSGDDGDGIVLELVDGLPLSRLLAEGRIDGAAAVRLARQVAEGLAAAHAGGLVHRDLKAENVMVTSAGQAKILDFGLARLLGPSADGDSLTREGDVVGTLRALSPEQARGGEVDERSDLFSFGVLLYELSTGCSPFRGATPGESLHRILAQRPAAPRELRPELPRELSRLVEDLLEKDPARRPASAARVAERLGEIERLPGLDKLGPPPSAVSTAGWSELPTGELAASLPRRSGARRGWAAAAVAVLAAAAAAAVWIVLGRGIEPRRVVVLPVAPPAGEGLGLVALGVEEAALSALADLAGVEGVAAAEAGSAVSPQAAARAAAADEVIAAKLSCAAGECRVFLRRVQGEDSSVLGVAEPFWVPTAAQDARDLVASVRSRLHAVFPEHRPRALRGEAEVRDRDYVSLLALLDRRERADRPPDAAELAALEELLAGSPGLMRAYPLAAGTARTLGDLARAGALLDRGQALDPHDVRLLAERFRLQIAAGRLDLAAVTLGTIDAAAPGQSLTLSLLAELSAARGDLEAAVQTAAKVVRRRPSWRHLLALADFETRLGRHDQARGHLGEAVERSPGNVWVLAKEAELELRYGDLGRAERAYRRLIAARPLALYHRNLGWLRYVRGDYGGAVASYRAAAALDPDHLLGRFNLAAARQAAGERAAREAFAELRLELEAVEGEAGAQASLLLAQCRARLGDSAGAYALVQRTVRGEPEDPQDLFLAAQVFALLGERLAALDCAERARKGGLRPEWLTIPELSSLRAEPRFQRLRR